MSNDVNEAAPPVLPSKLESAKQSSGYLRGSIAQELDTTTPQFSAGAESILKHHGIYQQDDRDHRRSGQREYRFLVRTRLPGGFLTAEQLLTELQLCDDFGDGTIRITDRQGLQLHGVLKGRLRDVVRQIDLAKMTTFGACGDVVRNVMCCPAPLKQSSERVTMRHLTNELAEHFALRSRAYHEIWLDNGEQLERVGSDNVDEDPLYGAAYLPRKFKFAFALPDDNCTDALTHDVGFVAIPRTGSRQWFNVYVGGGMGVTPARADTFPAVAQLAGLVESDQLVSLAHAIVQLYRECGNRTDRKRARFKYLIAEWGMERFRHELQRVWGNSFAPPEQIAITGLQTHLGWHEQSSGVWFHGVRIESGRIKDGVQVRLKSALRDIAANYPISVRLTPLQDILLCDIPESARDDIEQILRSYGVLIGPDLQASSLLAMACPALPTCGLAITESERVLPGFLQQLHEIQRNLGLGEEAISLRMTGCPNGCARPYVAEIGIVGKAADRYTLFLGGTDAGTQLAYKFRDMLSLREILDLLSQLLAYFAETRLPKESFGAFCSRIGCEPLTRLFPPT